MTFGHLDIWTFGISSTSEAAEPITWTSQAAEPITIYEIPTMNCVGCTFAAYVYFWGFKIGALKSGAIISLLKKFPEVLNLREIFYCFLLFTLLEPDL